MRPLRFRHGRMAAASRRGTRGDARGGVHHVPLPGADLLICPRPGVPLVRLGVYRRRPAPDRPEQAGLGMLAVRSAVRGTRHRDAAALADAFERLGGGLTTALSHEVAGFAATVLSDHLADAAALLHEVLHEPAFDPEMVALERGLLQEDARQEADDMYRRPMQLAFAAAFGGQGYGLPVTGTEQAIAGLDAGQADAWHRDLLGAGRATVLAVGEFEIEPAVRVLEGVFGGGPVGQPVATSLSGDWHSARPDPVVETRDKAQTALAMLFPGPDRLHPDRHAAEVFAAWAGGLGGRLFEALRDRRSLAYTVAAWPWQRRGVGGLITYIATSPGRESEARDAMLSELRSYGAAPPPPDEVTGAAGYLIGQSAVTRQSIAGMASEILDGWLHGTGLDELEDPAAPLRAVDGEAVRALAAGAFAGPPAEGVVRGRQG